MTLGAAPFVGLTGTAALFCSNFLINMRILSPLGMLNFLHRASREGALIKDGRSLQTLAQADTVVFDKTGTLTLEQPRVRNIHTFGGTDEDRVLSLAATAEYRQTHPIALAILEEAGARGLNAAEIDEANYKIGYGITVKTGGHEVRVGSQRFMETEETDLPDTFADMSEQSHEQGCSLVCVAADDRLIGAIEMEPAIRPEAEEVIRKLRRHRMTFYIISGDHETPTRKMAEKLGIDHYFAQVLPGDKAELVGKLQEQGRKVCFVGDGINDSIALKKADVSVSMLGASTIATDSAQIVLMDRTLRKLPDLFDISRGFQENMKDIRSAKFTLQVSKSPEDTYLQSKLCTPDVSALRGPEDTYLQSKLCTPDVSALRGVPRIHTCKVNFALRMCQHSGERLGSDQDNQLKLYDIKAKQALFQLLKPLF